MFSMHRTVLHSTKVANNCILHWCMVQLVLQLVILVVTSAFTDEHKQIGGVYYILHCGGDVYVYQLLPWYNQMKDRLENYTL